MPPCLQLYDVRMQRELISFRGHNRDVTYAAWHPLHEELFVSGGWHGVLDGVVRSVRWVAWCVRWGGEERFCCTQSLHGCTSHVGGRQ